MKKNPELLKNEVSAYDYVTENISFSKMRIGKTHNIQLFLISKEAYVLKREVSIEDIH